MKIKLFAAPVIFALAILAATPTEATEPNPCETNPTDAGCGLDVDTSTTFATVRVELPDPPADDIPAPDTDNAVPADLPDEPVADSPAPAIDQAPPQDLEAAIPAEDEAEDTYDLGDEYYCHI